MLEDQYHLGFNILLISLKLVGAFVSTRRFFEDQWF